MLSAVVVQAYQRQKLAAQEELTSDNNPVLACKEKAIYLLKFGGLTRVQLKQEVRRKKALEGLLYRPAPAEHFLTPNPPTLPAL